MARLSNSFTLPTMGIVSDTALEIEEKLTADQWRELGLQIARTRGATQWWIGDWWAFGENKYGERKAIVEADDWEGPAFQTCMNAAQIARAYETSRRREVLSFKHHMEVVALSVEWQDKLLDEAEEKDLSTSVLRQRVKEVRSFLAQGWTPSQLERKAKVEAGKTVTANMGKGEDGLPIDRALIDWADAQGKFERIDRNTEWGNPFVLGEDGDRVTVIENYAWYLERKPSLLKKVKGLKGKVLGCWCCPDHCHGDILIAEAEQG